MSFNLGVSNHPISRLGGLSSIGVYLYEDIYYRQWINLWSTYKNCNFAQKLH